MPSVISGTKQNPELTKKVDSGFRFVSIFSLLFHFHLKTRFQFHSNLLIENGDPVDRPSGEGLAVFRNGHGHFFQEGNHVVHSCLQVGSLCCLDKDILAVSPEVINLKPHLFHQCVIAGVVNHLWIFSVRTLLTCSREMEGYSSTAGFASIAFDCCTYSSDRPSLSPA